MTFEYNGKIYLDAEHLGMEKGAEFILGQQDEFLKEAEEIPGISNKGNYGDLTQLRAGQIYTLLSQLHEARRAGPHHDLRIGSPDMGLLSWASRKGLPSEPGKKHLAIQQPVHSWDYKDFQGDIESGYGAGKVQKEFERPIVVTSVGPDKISFSTADKKHPERYNLVKTPQGWLVVNSTPTQPIPYQKLHYNKIPPGSVEELLRNFQPGTSLQAKIDGASSLVELQPHGLELYSYRSARNTGRPIVHTERLFGGTRPKLNLPPELVGSVLKGELYGVRDGKAIPMAELGGLLNAGVGRSLEAQKAQNVQLRNALFDIQQHNGRPIDFQSTPYSERRRLLQQIVQHLPQDQFHLTPEATTPEEARQLWEEIQAGTNPFTHEGIVVHPATGKPIKSKLHEDADVWIKGIFPGTGKYQDNAAGGFEYSLEPHGQIAGRVGTGLSDEMRRHMWTNPNDWVGRVAKIRSQQQHPSGAYRAPAFISLHEDITGEPAEKMAHEVGKHWDTPDTDYNKKELSQGADVEREHTDSREVAKEIAKDHLSESPEYYKALDEMEAQLEKDGEGMPIFERAFLAQASHPFVAPSYDMMYNLAENIRGWHQHGQRMANEEMNSEALADQMNNERGWQHLRDQLGGKSPVGPVNYTDRLLFT